VKVYRNYTQEELDTQYEHRKFVLNADEYIERTRKESERVRAALKGTLDVRYGATKDEKLDIFPAKRAKAPVMVYIHGGRWQMQSKAAVSYPAETFVAAGVTWISVGFRMYPHVQMDEVVRQNRAALAWVWRNAESFGGDPDRVYLSGHSSGAHLAAMLATTDWAGDYEIPADVLKGVTTISGMYDLEPVRLSARNDILKLDMATALRNSPIHRLPPKGMPLIIGAGGIETDEFRRHPREFAAAWTAKGFPCQAMEFAGLNHFDTQELFNKPDGPLVKAILAQMDK